MLRLCEWQLVRGWALHLSAPGVPAPPGVGQRDAQHGEQLLSALLLELLDFVSQSLVV